jgi:hypothetical protein
MEFREDLKYGLQFYPQASTAFVGLFLSGTGPTLLRSFSQGFQGVTGFRAALLVATLLLQLGGGILVFAGVFGALRKVLEDTN